MTAERVLAEVGEKAAREPIDEWSLARRSRMPEPASAALRRLHEEAHRGLPEYAAKQFLLNALPALADLVKAVEMEPCSKCGWTRVPCQETPLCRALAALAARLGAQ